MDSLVLSMFTAAGQPEMVWVFDTAVTGASYLEAVLPFFSTTETHDVHVDWGDGTESDYTGTYTTARVAHTYATDGVYTIRVTGEAPVIGASNPDFGDRPSLASFTKCLSFGDLNTVSAAYLFYSYFDNLSQVPISLPKTVTNCEGMFRDAGRNVVGGFNPTGVAYWDTANVTNMAFMFSELPDFSQDVSGWNTSNVTNMQGMFQNSVSFNGNVSAWDVSSVTDMSYMFSSDTTSVYMAFNQDLSGWDVSNVTTMAYMFRRCSAFNQDLSGWDVSAVTTFREMFYLCYAFDQNIGAWATGAVTNMVSMFAGASSFNQDLSGWCVTNITSKPSGFDTGATAWTLPSSRPVWGTCPP